MTTQDVDPDTYYAVGKGLFEKAAKLYDAFSVHVGTLGGTASMAGSDDAGTAWATSYDERAGEVLGAVGDLIKALENYGRVVIQAGYNHAIAEHNATPGNAGPAPSKPPNPASIDGTLSAPPSAGGPGNGLIDDAIGLVEQIGVPVPDGDTDKVAKAADSWDRMATVYQTQTVVEGLAVDARTFRDTKSPEVEFIVRDLEDLGNAASTVLDGCAELSQSCKDYGSALDNLRDQLEGILKDLAIELAVTATVAIAASFVSFGAGAVAGTAKAAQSITKFARLIAEAIAAWKITKNIAKGVRRVKDIPGVRQICQRIKALWAKVKPTAPPARSLGDLFKGRTPKASELEDYATSQGWTKTQTPGGPPKYVDENGVPRMTIKEGSPRTPGSEGPHVELRDATGQRIDPEGNPVTRRSEGNHTPIEWDW